MRVDVFVDDERVPRASFEPPGELELDTSDLADGPHVLRVRAAEGEGPAGTRRFPSWCGTDPASRWSGCASKRWSAGACRSW